MSFEHNVELKFLSRYVTGIHKPHPGLRAPLINTRITSRLYRVVKTGKIRDMRSETGGPEYERMDACGNIFGTAFNMAAQCYQAKLFFKGCKVILIR